MGTLLQDARFAVRVLLRNAGVTVPAVLALALGIGANAAIFSVVSAVLLRPLPYREMDRLVVISESLLTQGLTGLPASYPEYADLQRLGHAFDGWAAYGSDSANLAGPAGPIRVQTGQATASLFPLLGVNAERGRTFSPEEDGEGHERVLLLGHRFWKSHLGGDPGALGRTLTLDGAPATVVGILPPWFDLPSHADVWVPFAFTAELKSEAARDHRFLQVLARMRPGVTVEKAREDLQAVARDIRAQAPSYEASTRWELSAQSLADATVGSVRTALWVLLGAVGLVLLIACGNVANLLLAQGSARQRELAIRSALGASQGRLAIQLLTESAILAALGGAAGLLLANWGVNALVSAAPASLPRADEIRLDGWIVAATLGLSVLTSLVFGLAPAVQGSRVNVHQVMTEGGRETGARAGRGRAALVIGEVALALVLLLGAGLLLRSFQELTRVKPGFEPRGALTATFSLPQTRYAEESRTVGFLDELLRRASALPGVTAAGATTALPLTDQVDVSFKIESWTPPPGEGFPDAEVRMVTADYFRALGASVVSGRALADGDRADAPHAVVVNQALARRYFPGADPVGKRIRLDVPRPSGEPWPWATVVGVVGDLREWGLDQPARPAMYFSAFQVVVFPRFSVALRSAGEPAGLANALRREVAALDPELPLYDVVSLETLVERSVGQRRFSTDLLALFAAVALALSAVGIYGLVSFSVTQRTREMGIRMALGASGRQVMGMVLSQSSRLALWGVLIGLGAGAALTRLMAGLLYGVSALDPATMLGVASLMVAVALLASAVPAWRATRVDPMLALRSE